MGDLSGPTLIRAIQAVNNEIRKLARQTEGAHDPERSELEETMLSYSKAEMELKKVYLERRKKSDNLPPYEELFDAGS